MPLLLRAIVDADAAAVPEMVVVRGRRVAAVASRVDGPARIEESALRAHHREIERIHAIASCLPARYGRLFADDAALLRAVGSHEDELAASLDAIGGRVELAAVLRWVRPIAPPDRASGTSYLRSRQAAETARGIAEAVVARLVADLHIERPHVRHESCPAADIAASIALLVERSEVRKTEERIHSFGTSSGVVAAEVYGPMPPYTFAS